MHARMLGAHPHARTQSVHPRAPLFARALSHRTHRLRVPTPYRWGIGRPSWAAAACDVRADRRQQGRPRGPRRVCGDAGAEANCLSA
eukprot:1464825-Prymnesium_polylepis.1